MTKYKLPETNFDKAAQRAALRREQVREVHEERTPLLVEGIKLALVLMIFFVIFMLLGA